MIRAPTRRHCLAALLAALALVTGRRVRAGGASGMDTALIEAARQGDAAEVARLQAAGADAAAHDDANRTALHHATEGNHIAAALALIEAGADVNASDGASIDHTPYLMAGARGYLEILEPMLAHGADLASTNGYGGTALIPACERGFVEVVRVLIEAGTVLDHVNRLGWTALLEAIILSEGGPAHREIVRLLLEAGADPALADRDGVTPLTHAEARGYEPIAALLRAHGA
jgi:ankyrin repeat protein